MVMLDKKYIEKIKNLEPFYASKVLPDLFTWNDLENHLNFRPAITDRRLKKIGNDNYYTWKDAGGFITDTNAYPTSVIKEVLKQSAVYLIDSSRISKKIHDVVCFVEQTLNIPGDCHIFITMK